MFCQKCGTRLDVTETVCTNCNTRIVAGKFCQKCGETMPGDAKVCGACNTRVFIRKSPLQWLSLGLSFVAFLILGIDYYAILHWFFSMFIFLAALISAFVFKGYLAVKIISIIIAAPLFLIVLSEVLLYWFTR